MNKAEKIKAEIGRLIEMNKTKNGFPAGTMCAVRIEAYEKLLDFITTLDEQPSEDLEKAAHHIAIETLNDTKFMTTTMGYALGKLQDIFLAGAEWQKEQMNQEGLEEEIKRYGKEEMPVVLESDLNDIARHFAEWQREQMLKDAIDGIIFQSEDYYPKELVATYTGDLESGDKVKVIIVKED